MCEERYDEEIDSLEVVECVEAEKMSLGMEQASIYTKELGDMIFGLKRWDNEDVIGCLDMILHHLGETYKEEWEEVAVRPYLRSSFKDVAIEMMKRRGNLSCDL